jgi:hypothetical protein
MLGIPSPYLAAGAAIAGMVLVGGAYLKGEGAGFRRCEVKTLAAAATEKARQARENQIAKTFEAMVVADAIARQKDLERQIRELTDAADSDPDAGNCGLSHDGVRRHNAFAAGKGAGRPATRQGGQRADPAVR